MLNYQKKSTISDFELEAKTRAILRAGETGLPYWYFLKESYEKTIDRHTKQANKN